MSAPENPPAFPWLETVDTIDGGSGMDLRDWFAGQCAPRALELAFHHIAVENSPCPEAARLAYEMADAMLLARTPNTSKETGQ